jgi:vacuolar-type H+-ATPase subunit H
MAKEKKVHTRITPKYTSSSDEESSDYEVDYNDLFKGLDRSKVDKINELIDALNEKDKLLEKQEDILYEEHDKFINVQKALALETKNELLTSELSAYNDSKSKLKNLNVDLNAKLEEVNSVISSIEHVFICNRCKDFNIDACKEHASTIHKLNNDVASLNAQLKTCKDNYEKLKFARDAYTIGRYPSIKDGLGFQKEAKNITSQGTPSLTKGKGRLPWLVALRRTMPIFMIRELLILLIMISVIIMLFLMYVMMMHLVLMPCLHLAPHMLMVEIVLGTIMILLMRLGEHPLDLLLFIKHVMLHLYCYVKMIK